MFAPQRFLVSLLAFLPAACGESDGPSVILITVDTLRSDHLSAYGYWRMTSPNIDALAERGVLFKTSYSQTNSTNPSHTTLFTGRHMRTHGVVDNLKAFDSDELGTLAEHFQRAGYETGAVVSVAHLNPSPSGLDRGFDDFVSVEGRRGSSEPAYVEWTRSAAEAVAFANNWIRARGRRPYFLWLHLFDTHLPYVPEEEFELLFIDHLAGRVAVMKRLHLRQISPEELYRQDPDLAPMEKVLFEAVYDHEIPADALIYNGVGWTEEEVETLTALYDSEISQVDHALGGLIDVLDLVGERPLVVLTGDHGEAFGKGGIYFDHRGIFEPSVRVPLIVAWDGVADAGRRVAEPVQAIDIAPTILELAGLGCPDDLPGQSLAGAVVGTDKPARRPIFIEHANRSAVAMVDGRWKLILSLLPNRASGEDWVYRHEAVALYNLERDPAERTNLSESEPIRLSRMTQATLSWLAATEEQADKAALLTPEVRERLTTLGYFE